MPIPGRRGRLPPQVDPKASVTCMAHSPRGYVASGVHSLLLGTENGYMLAVHPVKGAVRMVCNLATHLPAGASPPACAACVRVCMRVCVGGEGEGKGATA